MQYIEKFDIPNIGTVGIEVAADPPGSGIVRFKVWQNGCGLGSFSTSHLAREFIMERILGICIMRIQKARADTAELENLLINLRLAGDKPNLDTFYLAKFLVVNPL